MEWNLAASIEGHTISPDVGPVYGVTGYQDFYINNGLEWGVELMREGQKLDDRIKRSRTLIHSPLLFNVRIPFGQK